MFPDYECYDLHLIFQAEIIAAVEKVCSILPSQYQSECNTLIQQYGDSIIQLLVNLVDPQKLCSELKLCASSLLQLPGDKVL